MRVRLGLDVMDAVGEGLELDVRVMLGVSEGLELGVQVGVTVRVA